MIKAAFAVLLVLASAARAAEPPAVDPRARFEWGERPRFRSWEYALTGAALLGSAANFYIVPPPQNAVWRGQILFDQRARNSMLIPISHRDAVKVVADALTGPLVLYAMLDGPVTARWAGRNRDTAIQLALINAETFAVIEVMNLTVSNLIPRDRPQGAVCDPASKYDPQCVKSFWSGHTANVFTAAALVCAEHRAMGLYGGGNADKAACAGSLAVASLVGASRIGTNNHHASDVVFGAVVGSAVGYLLPNYLHFQFKKSGPDLGYLIPNVNPRGGGLTYVKAW